MKNRSSLCHSCFSSVFCENCYVKTLINNLTDSPEQLEEVDEELFESLIDRLTIQSAEQLNIQLRNGLILTEPMERTVR